MTLDVLFKGPMRKPLPRVSRLSGLLPITLLLIHGSREIRTIKIRLVFVAVPIAIRALVAAITNPIIAKIKVVLLLCKMSRGQQRWRG